MTIFYQRNCSGCLKPRSFLKKGETEYTEKDVRKNPISVTSSLNIVKRCRQVVGVIGKKVISYDLKQDKPTDEELKKIIIGRSGTMRAPCLQVDDVFIGGYNEDLYKKALAGKKLP